MADRVPSAGSTEHAIRPVTRRDLEGMFLVAAALFGCVAVAMLAVSLESETVSERSRGLPMAVFFGLAVSAVLCDRLCVKRVREHDRFLSVASLSCSSVLAACAGTVASFAIHCTQPMTIGMLLASCCVAVDMAIMMVHVTDPTVDGVVSAVLVASLCIMLASAGTLIFALPVRLLAGLILGVSVCCLQMLPNIVVHVPDRYLVEWRTYMTRRWTVRGGIPERARTLTRADIHDDMQTFQARYSAGFVVCLTLLLTSYAAVAGYCPYDGRPYDRIGFLTLSAALFLFLVLKPRQSGRPFERCMMRLCAVVVLSVCCAGMPHALPVIRHDVLSLVFVLSIGVFGLIMAFCMLAQQNGFHSLALSRMGDVLCFASMMLVPVAAFFASGALEFIRGL